jgi:hypothetical protein
LDGVVRRQPACITRGNTGAGDWQEWRDGSQYASQVGVDSATYEKPTMSSLIVVWPEKEALYIAILCVFDFSPKRRKLENYDILKNKQKMRTVRQL